jgi:hypothetical protein
MIIEIDAGSDPIAGRLSDERGTRSFTGWLELADALQGAMDPRDRFGRDEGRTDEGIRPPKA